MKAEADDVASIKSLRQLSEDPLNSNITERLGEAVPALRSASNLPSHLNVCHNLSGKKDEKSNYGITTARNFPTNFNPVVCPKPRAPLDHKTQANQFIDSHPGYPMRDCRINKLPTNIPARYDTPMPQESNGANFVPHNPYVYYSDQFNVYRNQVQCPVVSHSHSYGLARSEARRNPQLNLVFRGGCKRAYLITEQLKKALFITAMGALE